MYQKLISEKRQSLQQMVLGKLDRHIQKTKTRLKIKSKLLKEFKTGNLKVLGENLRAILQDLCIGNDFLKRNPKAWEIRAIIDKWEYTKLKKLLQSKNKNYQSEETTYRMEENLNLIFI
jgi:hypothetical protein